MTPRAATRPVAARSKRLNPRGQPYRTKADVTAAFYRDVVPTLAAREWNAPAHHRAWGRYIADLIARADVAPEAAQWHAPPDRRIAPGQEPRQTAADHALIDRGAARALRAFMLHTPDGERFGAALRRMPPGSITAAPHRVEALRRLVDEAVDAFDLTFHAGGAPYYSHQTREYLVMQLYRQFVWKSHDPAELARVDRTHNRALAWARKKRRPKRVAAKANGPRKRAPVPGQGDLFAPRPAPAAPVLSAADIERAQWAAGAPARWTDAIAKIADHALPFHVFGVPHRVDGPGFVRWDIIPLCEGPSGQSVTVEQDGRVVVRLSTGNEVVFPYGVVDEENSPMGPYQTYDRMLRALWSDGPVPPAAFGGFWHTEDPLSHDDPTLAAWLRGPLYPLPHNESIRTRFIVEGPVVVALQCMRMRSPGVTVERIEDALSEGMADLRFNRKGSDASGYAGLVTIAPGVVMHLKFLVDYRLRNEVLPVRVSFEPIPATMITPGELVQSARDAEYWVPATSKAVSAAKWDRKRFGPVKQRVIGEAEKILAVHSKKRWATPIKALLRELQTGADVMAPKANHARAGGFHPPPVKRMTRTEAVAYYRKDFEPHVWLHFGRADLSAHEAMWRRFLSLMVQNRKLPSSALDWRRPSR